MERLKQRLDDFGFDGIYRLHMGYIVQLGNAKIIFLSAEGSSSVVGHTADILLEIYEAQDVSKEKYTSLFCLQFDELLELGYLALSPKYRPRMPVSSCLTPLVYVSSPHRLRYRDYAGVSASLSLLSLR